MKDIKVQKIPSPQCPRPECKSPHGNLSKGIFWCMECGKFLDPRTGKYKDFNRGTVGTSGKLPDCDNNYDAANPRAIGTIPVVKEVR